MRVSDEIDTFTPNTDWAGVLMEKSKSGKWVRVCDYDYLRTKHAELVDAVREVEAAFSDESHETLNRWKGALRQAVVNAVALLPQDSEKDGE